MGQLQDLGAATKILVSKTKLLLTVVIELREYLPASDVTDSSFK